MQIKFTQITNFFDEKGILYSLKGHNNFDEYKICSLLFPEEKGFYFLEEGYSDENILDSLILTHWNFETVNNNAILRIKESPQIIYYELLNHYFKEVSTGKICNTAIIHKDAIIGENVQIDSYTVIGKCEIGANSIIKGNCVLTDMSQIGKNTIIEPNCTIGATGIAWVWNKDGERVKLPQIGGVSIGDSCTIGANSVIVKGSLNERTVIGNNSVFAPGAKVGHGSQIGCNVHFANNVVLGGNTTIGENSFIGSGAVFRSKTLIHPNTIVAAGAVVIHNTRAENLTLIGVPAQENISKSKLSGVPKLKKK